MMIYQHGAGKRRLLTLVVAIAALCALIVGSAGGTAFAAGSNDTGPIGLDAMTASGWNQLPDIDTQVISGEFSSFDRTDANDDGFTGNGFYATEPNGDKTVASIQGPGEITRLFFAGDWPADTQLKIYLDGSATPNIDESFGYFFAGTNAPYLSPLVEPETGSGGGYSSYLPITFAQSIKIDLTLSPENPDGDGSVYDVDYQKYPAGTAVTTFNPSDTSNPEQASVNSLWSSTGSDPKQPTGEYSPVTGTVTVPSNGATTIFNAAGPAQIDAIKLTVPGLPGNASTSYGEDLLNNIAIRIYWDGQSTPAIDAPLGSFFGTGIYGGAQPAKALPFGFDGTSFYMYLPMPFQDSATIQLYSNRAAATAGISYTVLYQPYTGSFANVGELYTQYHFTRARATDPFDYVALSAVGSGKFVGLVTNGSGAPNPASPYNDQAIHWMEGDPHIYIDGSRSPQYAGTGTEDFFGGAGYFCCTNGVTSYPGSNAGFSYFTDPLNGFTAHEYPTSTTAAGQTGNMAMYRALPSDGINFHSSIVVGFQHGGGIRPVEPPSNAVPLNTYYQNQNAEVWTLAFYYYQPDATDVLSDTLNVGNSSQESSHDYTTSGASSATAYTGSWEGDLDAVTATLHERSISGYSQFTMAVSPDNQGVVLRRTFNQSTGPQSADVYVNGQLVGPWSYLGANSTFQWRDDDFQIPSSFTANDSSITIKVVNTGSVTWNEARYQTYSIVAPQSTTMPDLQDGATFQITSLASHLDLDISGGSTSSGAGVVQTASAGAADGQLWRAVSIPGGSGQRYAFVDVNSGLVLGGSANSPADQETWTGAADQQWDLSPAPTGGYYIAENVGNSSGSSTEVLDDTNASTAIDNPIQQYTENESSAQQWRFEQQDVPPTQFPVTTGIASTPAPIQSGTAYTVNSGVSGLDLDLTDGQPSSAGQLVQEYTPDGTCAQQWIFNQVAAGTYTIQTTCASNPSGQTLVLQDQGKGNQVAVEPLSGSSGSAAQQWQAELVKDGVTDSYYRLVNVGDGNVLNVCNSGQSGCTNGPGDKVQSYTWDGTVAGLWRLQAQDTPTCSTLPDGCGRWYELSPLSNTSLNLDDEYASAVAGAGTQVYAINHTCSQEWRADYVVNGYYKLTNLCGDKVLDVVNAGTGSGSTTQIWDWNGTDSELWKITPAATPGYFTFTNKASGLVLDAGASASGTGVTISTSNPESSSQQWAMNLEP